MSRKEEIKKEMLQIDEQIQYLSNNKKDLLSELLSLEDDFIEKFKTWYNSDDECHSRYIPDGELISHLVDRRCEDRYRTYHISDLFEEELYAVLRKEDCIARHGQDFYDAEINKITPLLKEIFAAKVKSFVLDW